MPPPTTPRTDADKDRDEAERESTAAERERVGAEKKADAQAEKANEALAEALEKRAEADRAKVEAAEAEAQTRRVFPEEVPPSQIDIVDIIARLAPDQLARLKAQLGVVPPPGDPSLPVPFVRPLHERAGIHPIDVEATSELAASDAASKLGGELDELLAFSIRAPRNLDGKPISEKAVLTGVFTSGEKRSVEIG